MYYQPKKSTARWLENAPAPVLACYDSGPETVDRYIVLYGGPFYDPSMGRRVQYVAMSAEPNHPLGFCQHGETESADRKALGKKIRFDDLPLNCRRQVRQECESALADVY